MDPESRANVMSTGSRFHRWLVGQFGHPTGVWGGIAGWTMALRASNRRRNRWTVDLLELKPGSRVLEIGFGPGLALSAAVARVGVQGLVAGIDGSSVMLAQARRRNAEAVRAGTMDLREAVVEALPDFGAPFDAILAVNTIGFWPDPDTRLRELRERLSPGGRLAVTVQPRAPGASAADSARIGEQLRARLCAAGFNSVTVHTLPLDPPAVCVTGAQD